jgi:hypothetical protein
VSENIDIATDEELRWLNDGFDEGAMKRLDAAHFDEARDASPTPPHWRFVDAEVSPGESPEGAAEST